MLLTLFKSQIIFAVFDHIFIIEFILLFIESIDVFR